jgi:hypothetical protein
VTISIRSYLSFGEVGDKRRELAGEIGEPQWAGHFGWNRKGDRAPCDDGTRNATRRRIEAFAGKDDLHVIAWNEIWKPVKAKP